jgi:uncharacterized protein
MSVKIGCLSDTHGFYDERLESFFSSCEEIWHAGDIGSMDVAERLSSDKPFKAVHGNIDNYAIRRIYPAHQRFTCQGVDVWITHIGGYPGKYDNDIRDQMVLSPPGLFICGHSHILKIMNDEKLGLLHINPGAAGRSGFHKVQTAVRFVIDGGRIKDLEIAELIKSG